MWKDHNAVFIGFIRTAKNMLEGKLVYNGETHEGFFEMQPVVNGEIQKTEDNSLKQKLTDIVDSMDHMLSEK
jgi:hypothetical protein